jgi:hypothetical protein
MLSFPHMKRSIALTLILLILFNTMGFYGVLVALRYQNEQSLLSDLDAGAYNVAREKLIKLPIHLPYSVDQFDFERVDGEFHHEGIHYRLVKQKLANDTLYVVCIEDHGTKKIDQALTEYVKTFADGKTAGHADGKTTVTFGKDYLLNSFSVVSTSCGWSIAVPVASTSFSGSSEFVCAINHPPQLA